MGNSSATMASVLHIFAATISKSMRTVPEGEGRVVQSTIASEEKRGWNITGSKFVCSEYCANPLYASSIK